MGERWPVRASDGHTFELTVGRPSQPEAVLFFVPAMGVEASYYGPFIEALSQRGVLVAICDLRGHGTSSLRPRRSVDFGYREIVELDYYRNWRGRSRAFVRLATLVFPVAGFILGYVPGDRLGFGGTEARSLMRDWSRNAMTARYELIGSAVDYESALGKLEIELLTVNIDGDDMAPPNAVDFMFEKAPQARGVRVEAKLSENKSGAHVRWARDPASVVRAVADWIARHR